MLCKKIFAHAAVAILMAVAADMQMRCMNACVRVIRMAQLTLWSTISTLSAMKKKQLNEIQLKKCIR